MKKRWSRRLRANGKRKADMHRYYSYYWWFKSFTEKRGMMGILLLNLSNFAGAVNPRYEVFPLLLAPRFRVSFKAPCAARLPSPSLMWMKTPLIPPSAHPRPSPDFISAQHRQILPKGVYLFRVIYSRIQHPVS